MKFLKFSKRKKRITKLDVLSNTMFLYLFQDMLLEAANIDWRMVAGVVGSTSSKMFASLSPAQQMAAYQTSDASSRTMPVPSIETLAKQLVASTNSDSLSKQFAIPSSLPKHSKPTAGIVPTSKVSIVSPLQHLDPRARSERKFSCERCDRSYTSASSLSRHMQTHTGKFSFYCEQCKRGFNERTNYDQHMAKHEGRSYYFSCQACSKRFISQQKLKDHMATDHVEFNYNCEYCGEGFNSLSRFREHEQKHLKDEI